MLDSTTRTFADYPCETAYFCTSASQFPSAQPQTGPLPAAVGNYPPVVAPLPSDCGRGLSVGGRPSTPTRLVTCESATTRESRNGSEVGRIGQTKTYVNVTDTAVSGEQEHLCFFGVRAFMFLASTSCTSCMLVPSWRQS